MLDLIFSEPQYCSSNCSHLSNSVSSNLYLFQNVNTEIHSKLHDSSYPHDQISLKFQFDVLLYNSNYLYSQQYKIKD